MPRHKRFAGDSGMRVPMIAYVPEKWKSLWSDDYAAGGRTDRLVSFVDLAPTTLKIAGAAVPKSMQGSSFLGADASQSKYNYGIRNRMDERNDVSRSISDGKFVYIRNFMPYLPHGQQVVYQQMTPTSKVWYQQFRDGKLNSVQSAFWEPRAKEELYDLEADPYETVNLASDESYATHLKELKTALRAKLLEIVDLDLVPELILNDYEQKTGNSRVLYAETDGFQMQELLDAAEGKDVGKNLLSPRVELQYWAIVNLIGSKEPGSFEEGKTVHSLMRNSPSQPIRVKAAEYRLSREGTDEEAIAVLLTLANINESSYYVAVNALDCLDRYRQLLDDQTLTKIRGLETKVQSIQRGNNYLEKLMTRFVN